MPGVDLPSVFTHRGKGGAGGYRLGLIYLFTASFFTSLAGIVVRQMEQAEGWQVLFYRSLALAATLLLFSLLSYRGRVGQAFRAIGRPGLAAAVFLAGGFALFIFALFETSVANVVFTVGLAPFFAALFARVLLGEAVAPGTWAAMLVSFLGVGVMFGDGMVAGSLLGNGLALGCGLSYAAALVAMRKGRAVDMIPAVCLAGALLAVVAGLAAPSLAVSGRDGALAAFLGVVQLGFQYILLTAAIRHVPAAEVALIGRLSLVTAPLWVWLGVGETPSTLTLAGGAIVLVAIGGHGFSALRRS